MDGRRAVDLEWPETLLQRLRGSQRGYAFGFDGSILACIDLKDGQRK
jgi:hypothetical protein